jgi:hypothetical protein
LYYFQVLASNESDDTPKFIDAYAKCSTYMIYVSWYTIMLFTINFSALYTSNHRGGELLNMTTTIQVGLVSQADFLLETK